MRDYIHVCDLADAHLRALGYLGSGGKSDVFNLGVGNGYTVKEIIDTARAVTGIDIKAVSAPRRAGDPSTLIACSDKARRVLGWEPAHSDLETIIGSAWEWHRTHPDGYGDR